MRSVTDGNERNNNDGIGWLSCDADSLGEVMAGMMRPKTAVEVAANAAERWREQYKHWNDDDTFADGTSKGDKSLALNTNAHTPEKIAEILNKGWAYPECSCCGEPVDKVVQMKKDDWSDDVFDLCRTCIEKAALIIKG